MSPRFLRAPSRAHTRLPQAPRPGQAGAFSVKAEPAHVRAVGTSTFDATEGRVNVWIMRLEPIAKRPPQHARGCARRTAFHDEMFPVKKVRGVTGIKGKWLELRKRREGRARPFPAVSEKVGDAEIAGPAGK